jgi:siroheme synthase-like protein
MSRPEHSHYPVALDLRGRRVLLVGAGSVASRKLDGLLAAGAVVHVVASEVEDFVAARASELASISRRSYRSGDLDGAWYVVEATGVPEVAAQIAEDAHAARIFINAADQPDSCSAILPAVHRVGDLTITWSTGGRSPAFAGWIRDRSAPGYGPELGVLLGLVGDARTSMLAAGNRRSIADWRALLDSGILEEIRSGQLERAKERLQAWQSSSSE